MTTHPLWSDDYRLLPLQLYLKEPEGMKPTYPRALVDLSLELYILPKNLYEQLSKLWHRDMPIINLIREAYGENTRKLNKDVKKLRLMKGFGQPRKFYDGVKVCETFEHDFLPVEGATELKPLTLTMILDLYFRLIPIMMATETPEMIDLAKLVKIKPQMIIEVMDVFQFRDPCLNRDDLLISPLLMPCQEVWNRYGNDNSEKPSALAA